MSYNIRSYSNYGKSWDVQVGTSGTYTAIPGLNLGLPISGNTVNFGIPSGLNAQTTQLSVGASISGTVTVSGTAPNTINGTVNVVTISANTSKTLINTSGNDWTVI